VLWYVRKTEYFLQAEYLLSFIKRDARCLCDPLFGHTGLNCDGLRWNSWAVVVALALVCVFNVAVLRSEGAKLSSTSKRRSGLMKLTMLLVRPEFQGAATVYGSSLQCSCKGVSIATLDKGCVTLTTVEVWPWSLVWLQLIDHEPQVVAGKYIRLLTTTAMKPWLTWSGISPNCSVNWSNNTALCATCIHPHERKREITFCCSLQPSPTPVQIRA